ncbi:MAG: cynt3 [Bacteriovoracaceae bacterium]|nr:cynt3 [Bacteriovoracaceae bacterium]
MGSIEWVEQPTKTKLRARIPKNRMVMSYRSNLSVSLRDLNERELFCDTSLILVTLADLFMKKLVDGILEFRKNLRPTYRKLFSELALGQSPYALFIGCSDSRVAVNVFASTDPGDLFVSRNVGNLVPAYQEDESPNLGNAVAATMEFALHNLKVADIIICGHSECGAMHALIEGREKIKTPNLSAWLSHGESGLVKLGSFNSKLSKQNELSQINVLEQIEHLKTYPIVRERIKTGTLKIHGWWFDLKTADVYALNAKLNRFELFNEELVNRSYS